LTPQALTELRVERLRRRARTTNVRLSLSPLLSWQQQVVNEAARFNTVCVGRRAGKTRLAIHLCAAPEVLRHPVGWFSPSYKLMLEAWGEATQLFTPIIDRRNATERRLEFTTGGVLEFWSLDNPQAGRGRKYRRVIIDEAAFVPTLLDVWNHAIRPTLADLRGDGWLLSTPKGRNGFWQLWQRGQDDGYPDWRSWQMASSVNPLLTATELEEMRRSMPEPIWRQEIEAQFIDDAGGVFRRVMDAATATAVDRAQDGRQYVAGADWGRSNDFTVFAVIDVASRELVYLDRFTDIDYEIQTGRLRSLNRRFRPTLIMAEANAMGGPIVERLQSEGLPVQGFMTGSKTKEPLIRGLETAFDNGEIRILNDPALIGELQAYEQERLEMGWRFSAPAGMHDDCVMALALAWHGVDARAIAMPPQPMQTSRWTRF